MTPKRLHTAHQFILSSLCNRPQPFSWSLLYTNWGKSKLLYIIYLYTLFNLRSLLFITPYCTLSHYLLKNIISEWPSAYNWGRLFGPPPIVLLAGLIFLIILAFSLPPNLFLVALTPTIGIVSAVAANLIIASRAHFPTSFVALVQYVSWFSHILGKCRHLLEHVCGWHTYTKCT